jgi:hypothetical protein
MERSHPTSGRSATAADINRNGRPTSIGTSGRHQSECPADIIGMRNMAHAAGMNVRKLLFSRLTGHRVIRLSGLRQL